MSLSVRRAASGDEPEPMTLRPGPPCTHLLALGLSFAVLACGSPIERWSTLSRQPGPFRRDAPCGPSRDFWSFEQRGGEVQAEHYGPNTYRGGIAGRVEMPEREFVTGRRHDDVVTLEGLHRPGYLAHGPSDSQATDFPDAQEVHYRLRFDSVTGHVVGTRNGVTVRFAPLRYRPRQCPPPSAP